MTPLIMVIPGQPVGKARPRVTRAGHTYTPEKTRQHEELIGHYGRLAMRGYPPIAHHELSVDVTAFFAIPSSWTKAKAASALEGKFRVAPVDVDNIAKAVLDGLNGVVFHDDKQVVRLSVLKGYAREPKTIVRIEPLGLEDGQE